MTATYEKIDSTTLTSTSSSVTFSSIPGTYTDLVLIQNSIATSEFNIWVRFNSDTGNNYSYTYFVGDGAGSGETGRSSNYSYMDAGGTNTSPATTAIFYINSYSNTTTFKNLFSRVGSTSKVLGMYIGMWRSTSAITSVTTLASTSTFASGSTFTLYGIKAE
jgi:hypothetical protein